MVKFCAATKQGQSNSKITKIKTLRLNATRVSAKVREKDKNTMLKECGEMV